jgi:hypothetical protein
MARRKIRTKPFTIETEEGERIYAPAADLEIETPDPPTPPEPPDILYFTATPNEIRADAGETTILLQWTTAGAFNVRLDGMAVLASGQLPVTIGPAPHVPGVREFTLSAEGSGGITTETIVVKILPVEPTEPEEPEEPGSYVLRLHCGSANPYTAQDGTVWARDQYHTGGGQVSAPSISGTADPQLYRIARGSLFSNFSYRIPMGNGPARVTLKFAEVKDIAVGKRVFDVVLNGEKILPAFDIVAAAGAARKAVDRTFLLDVVDGFVSLEFLSVTDYGSVSAIEIQGNAPEEPTQPIPAPTIEFGADRETLPPEGGTVELHWTTVGAENVGISGGIGSVSLSGSVIVTVGITTTFTLTAMGPGGTRTRSVTVKVGTHPAPVPPTIDRFEVNPPIFGPGDELSLNWKVEGAESVTINQGVGAVNAEGTRHVTAIGTTTWTLTAVGPGGTASRSVKAEYIPAPIPGEDIHRVTSPAHFRQLIGDGSPVRPGDEIVVPAGMHMRGSFPIRIEGTALRRIKIRTERGYRHTSIDIGGQAADGRPDENFNNPAIQGGGRFWDLIGFQLWSSSNGPRGGLRAGSHVGPDLMRGDGFYAPSGIPGGNFAIIGCYIHNTRNGISWGTDKQIVLVDSCVLRDIGWRGADRTHGPSMYGKASADPALYCLIARCFSGRGFYYGPRYYGSGDDTGPASCYNGRIEECVAWNHGEAQAGASQLNPNCLIDIQMRDRASGALRGNVFIAAVPNGKTTGPWWERYDMDGWNLSTSVSGNVVWKDRMEIEDNYVVGSDANGACYHAVSYDHMTLRRNVSITRNGVHLEHNSAASRAQSRVWEANQWYGGRSQHRLNSKLEGWDTAKFGPIDPNLPTGTWMKWIANMADPINSVRVQVHNYDCLDVVPLDVKQFFNRGDALEIHNLEDPIGPPVWSGVVPDDHIVPVPARLARALPLPNGSNLPPAVLAYKSIAPVFLPLELNRVL